MKHYTLIICIFLIFSHLSTIAAKPTNDDTSFVNVDDDADILNNLDSLVHLWYVQQSLHSVRFDTSYVYLDSIKSDIPDSVYIQRLSKINTTLDLPYNEIVNKYIAVYTKRKREQVQVMLGLAEYYFPLFEEAFDAYNLPLELKYLAIIESSLNPRARSRAGAVGLWQFMYRTGKSYKLEVNTCIDERMDPIKSTYAAVQYLRDLYAIYGDWTLVIAAYNCGPGCVNRAIRRSGGKTNYWDIYYRLPKETRNYVPAFVAATYVMNYYKEHDLAPYKITLPTATDTVKISRKLHLQQVSQVLNIPIDILRNLNPQYKNDIIPAFSSTYVLKLPFQSTTQFVDLQDSIYNFNSSQLLSNVQLVAPSKSNSGEKYKYTSPDEKNKTKLVYEVKTGDNIGFISSWYNVKASDIRYWNGKESNRLKAGEQLTIYVPNNVASKYQTVNAMSFEEKQKMIGKSVQQSQTQAITYASKMESQEYTNDYVYYTIQKGENLWTIAQKFPGVTNIDIMRLNSLTTSAVRKLMPGDVIKIKKKN